MISNWAYWISAWIVCFGALVLIIWALFWDRPRGRRRCPKCWYDMRGSDSLTCSECGHTARRERQLYKTRRRMRCVGLAVMIILLGYGLHATPAVREIGWFGIFPNTLIIRCVGLVKDPDGPLALAIERRLEATGLWSWQRRWLAHRTLSNRNGTTRQWGAHLFFLQARCGENIDHAVPALLRALKGDDHMVRYDAIMALSLGLNDAETAVDEFVPLLHDSQQAGRFCAAMGLGRFGAEARDALPALIEALEVEQDDNVRLQVGMAICQIADDPATGVAAMREFLGHEYFALRNAAAITLGELGHKAAPAVPELTEATNDVDTAVQLNAIKALGAIGDGAEAAVPTLTELLEDEDPDVQVAAREALDRIETGDGESD